jgi:DNA-directed RNA polymerase specialized sigma24 family protein
MEPDVIAWPGPRHPGSPATTPPRAPSPDEVVAGLYSQHYVALVRLTVMLLRDLTAAETAVQDAFVAMHQRRLQDPDQALAYLRRAVVSESRSLLRHRTTAATKSTTKSTGMETSAVAAELGTLPKRQCEAVILRYYADLSDTETAAAMGVSEGAAKAHAHRGMAALRQRLEPGTGAQAARR